MNLADQWVKSTNFSSDEDEEDEEHDEETEANAKNDENKEKKNKKLFKPIGDWRTNRHEREQLVHTKMKSAVRIFFQNLCLQTPKFISTEIETFFAK
jgi:hypothetical protein